MNQEQQLNDIAAKVGRVEVLQEVGAKNINDLTVSVQRLVEKLEDNNEVSREALDRAKSAHHRIDGIEDRQKWTSRALIGAFITGAAALFWKGYGG